MVLSADKLLFIKFWDW